MSLTFSHSIRMPFLKKHKIALAHEQESFSSITKTELSLSFRRTLIIP